MLTKEERNVVLHQETDSFLLRQHPSGARHGALCNGRPHPERDGHDQLVALRAEGARPDGLRSDE